MTRTAPYLEPPRYLEGRRLLELLPPMQALRAIQRFFAGHGPESVVAPERIHLRVPGRETVGLYMPSATREYVGVKIVHLMPSRYPSVEAEIFLYDAETGRLLFWGDGKPLTVLEDARSVRNAEFSPDGLRVVTSRSDQTARIWDVVTGNIVFTLQHGSRVNPVKFIRDSSK